MVPRLSAQSLHAALAAPSPLAYARWPVLFGLVVVLGVVLGSIVWAALVPLASAAVAPGQVVVSSTRKVVQHLEGGIVKTIVAAEGDRMAAGDPLVVIDDTQARAQYDVVRSQYLALKAREARLIAERDGATAVAFDHPVFRETDIAGYGKAVEGQRTAFAARRKALTSQVEVNTQRIAQLKEQISGLGAQVGSADRQLVLIEEEHKDVKGLYERGNERKPRLLALERSMAEIIGTRGSYLAQIAQARQAIIETELKSLDITTQFNAEVVKELGEAQSQIADLEERFRTLADRVERSVVRAPIAGTVVNLRVHTEGGVIPPGGELLDLVPSGDELVIEAQVKPEDIDVVHAGQPVMVRVIAFDQRTVPPLDGTLSLVSADRLEDKRTGAPYYRARITLDPVSLARLDGQQLQPGMPVETMIRTGERPLLRTLVSPILHSLNRAFRES
jgi:HlyD family type I secretion membrane fusion protein